MVLQQFQSSFSHFEHIPKTYNMHPMTQNKAKISKLKKDKP
jgi:hypothetical protein